MFKTLLNQGKIRTTISALLTISSLLASGWAPARAVAQTSDFCQLSPEAQTDKKSLLQASLEGNTEAQTRYRALVEQHAAQLRQCRSQNWPQNQAIWLRLYPCDVRPGSIERVLDQIVSQGYNQVYLEVFFDGQVLLPPADNPTPWIPVVRSPGYENADLLARTIELGHQRGLEVYAWMFTLNFGYSYAQLPDRQNVLARNGKRENSINVVDDRSQAFVDPYSRQAQLDYYELVNAVIKRRPDGVLFDYIRYPRGMGKNSVVSGVKDLWIYGDASRQALLERAQNNRGRELIKRFVDKGDITVNDVTAVEKLYPDEGSPLWEGRNPSSQASSAPVESRYQQLRRDLWFLSVAHAAQGVLDFLAFASYPVERQGIPVGAVFFPEANQVVGQRGFDSRLQPWNNFPASIEWHPMSYGVCQNTGCIVDQVQRVVDMAPNQTEIAPALAGLWGQPYKNRPALESQMLSIQRANPSIDTVSHFAFSWQYPEIDRERKFCQL